jgi:hypothetical protein
MLTDGHGYYSENAIKYFSLLSISGCRKAQRPLQTIPWLWIWETRWLTVDH